MTKAIPWIVARCNTCGSANVDIGSLPAERDHLREVNADLLAALEAMLAQFGGGILDKNNMEPYASARAAIQKAKGE